MKMLKTTEKKKEEFSPKHKVLTKILMKSLSNKYNELVINGTNDLFIKRAMFENLLKRPLIKEEYETVSNL